ncbi:MAG TPA: ATP-binding protein [Stellaceae bacterium]
MPKEETVSTIAPLRNVTRFCELLDRVMKRSYGLPGMACFYGPSGFSKTTSAIWARNKHRAYHVQVKSAWSRKKLCTALCTELGIEPAVTIADMVDDIGKELALSRRPLIVDEADYLVSKSMIELIRDIYESSLATVILIGEEQLPQKLKKFERIHGRMLDWVQAEAASITDAKHLARLYCRGIEIGDDLIEALLLASAGSARRICVNLDRVREAAETADKRKIGRADFAGEFFTGQPPMRRAA